MNQKTARGPFELRDANLSRTRQEEKGEAKRKGKQASIKGTGAETARQKSNRHENGGRHWGEIRTSVHGAPSGAHRSLGIRGSRGSDRGHRGHRSDRSYRDHRSDRPCGIRTRGNGCTGQGLFRTATGGSWPGAFESPAKDGRAQRAQKCT